MRRILILLPILILSGCERPQIRSYFAPKDSTLDAVAPAAGADPMPKLTWSLPAGWQQMSTPKQMSVASFTIDDNHGDATVAITPLPNLAGREDQLVNMWREQVQLGPLSPEEMEKALVPAPVGGGEGRVFEIAGSAGGKPTRTVAAMLHRNGQSWFFKLNGDDPAVNARKAEFLEFVKGVRFIDPTPTAGQTSSNGGGSFQWKVPPAWTAATPGNMQVAKFAVPAQDSAKADVSVSVFPSESGGTLANVNRWRKQIGLGEIEETGLTDCTKPLGNVAGATVIDLKNDARSLLGAIVPRGEQWFFYKLMGDTAAVEAARADFLSFAQSEP